MNRRFFFSSLLATIPVVRVARNWFRSQPETELIVPCRHVFSTCSISLQEIISASAEEFIRETDPIWKDALEDHPVHPGEM